MNPNWELSGLGETSQNHQKPSEGKEVGHPTNTVQLAVKMKEVGHVTVGNIIQILPCSVIFAQQVLLDCYFYLHLQEIHQIFSPICFTNFFSIWAVDKEIITNILCKIFVDSKFEICETMWWISGNALGIWISGCKRWCPKDLRVHIVYIL